MKQGILMIFFLVGFCFSQTGMLVDKGNAGFGIWGEFSRDAECEYCDETTILSLDYMTKFGLEFGIDYGIYNDVSFNNEFEYDIAGYKLSYHYKSYSDANFYISFRQSELTDGDSDPLRELSALSLGYYSNNRSFIELSQRELVYPGYAENVNEFISFGGIIRFEKKAGLLISYMLDIDVLETVFDEEDLEYLKNGEITLSLGGVF